MNPSLVYESYYDEAIARRVTRSYYKLFLAMPLSVTTDYDPNTIRPKIDKSVASLKTGGLNIQTCSAEDHGSHAHSIDDTIVKDILDSNIVLADITGDNPGVLLELGIALASRREVESIIVITQDDLKELHFDLKNVNVVQYSLNDLVEKLTPAVKQAAESEEKLKKRFVTSIRKNLPVESIVLIKQYISFYQLKDVADHRIPLIYENTDFCAIVDRKVAVGRIQGDRFPGDPNSRVYFNWACDILIRNRLLVCDYHIETKVEDRLFFGYHLTDLGWHVVRELETVKSKKKLLEQSYNNWCVIARPYLVELGLLYDQG